MLNENDFAMLVISIGVTHNNGEAVNASKPIGVSMAGTLALSTPAQRLSFYEQALDSINQNCETLTAIGVKIAAEIEKLSTPIQ